MQAPKIHDIIKYSAINSIEQQKNESTNTITGDQKHNIDSKSAVPEEEKQRYEFITNDA